MWATGRSLGSANQPCGFGPAARDRLEDRISVLGVEQEELSRPCSESVEEVSCKPPDGPQTHSGEGRHGPGSFHPHLYLVWDSHSRMFSLENPLAPLSPD